MKIFKAILAISLFAVNSAFLTAQVSFDAVFSDITSSRVTSGDFLQEKTSAKIRRPLKSSGKFIFCDEGIVWQTIKPFPSTMAVTKDSLIQTGADGKKSVMDGNTNDVFQSVAATISSLFSGDRAVLENHFSVKSFSSDSSKWSMALTPKDATIASAIREISLSGNTRGGKSTLDEMFITQGEGENTRYTFKNQVYKQELSSDEKAFFQK